MPAYVITKAIWDAVQKTAVANDHVSGLLSDASYVVVDCDTDSEFRTLPAEVIPAITITKAPSEAGLDGLVAGMTAAEVLAAWTGRPLATVSNGKDPHYTHAVRIDGTQVTDLTATANLTIATTVSAAGAEDVVTLTDLVPVSTVPAVAELSAIAARNAKNSHKIDVTYSKALKAGYTASVYIGVNPNGDSTYLTNLSAGVTFTSKGSYPKETYVWVYIKDKAAEIVDSAVIAKLAAVGADPVDPIEIGVPDVGPYTLAQVEALRTDGTTRGVTIGRTLKKIGVDTLPVGFSRSGTRITVAANADVALVENWDFTGHDFIIRGRVRLFSNCKFGFPTDLQLCLIDMYPGSHIDAFKRCSFLGAGYYGSYTGKTCIWHRIGSPILNSSKIDLIERCDFFGWGGDVIKSVRGGVIRLCYFDTAINLPVGISKWSASKNYVVGDWVLSSDGKYAYIATTAGSNKLLPKGKVDNSSWKNQDPHSDTINPYFQFDPKLLIEACYINRLESTRAVDPGSARAIGINNGIRATRDSGNSPINNIEIANTIISKSEINESYPCHFQVLDQENTQSYVLRDSWIGKQGSGEIIHPSGRDGHTLTNVLDYTNPTESSASYGEAGTTASSGGTPALDPNPKPAPMPMPAPTPKPHPGTDIDYTKPAIVFSMAQSEPERVTSTSYYGYTNTRTNAPNLDAENFHMFHYNGAYEDSVTIIDTKATQTNRKNMSDGMIALANALNYAVPGKNFVLAAAHEAGSSRVSLSSDGGFPNATQNRKWLPTQKVVDAVLAKYPQGFDRMTEYWWAADGGLKNEWLRNFAPFYFKQTQGGAPVAFGSIPDTYRKQTLDHSIYDFNTSGPTVKGQGLFPRTVAMDVTKTGPNDGDTAADFTGVQAFMNDDRYKSLGGVYGHFGKGWITNDGSHPDPATPWGCVEAAYEFFMPTMLRAAGIPIGVPKFINVFTAADGSYAEVELHRPNGGVISTNGIERGEPAIDHSLFQQIYGFEISRAAGGGRYPIARPGSSGIDLRYHGTVTRSGSGKVRIVMTQPIQNGDKITYNWGRAAYRTPDDNHPRPDPYRDKLYRHFAIEHVPAYTDPDSVFPFAGFHAENRSHEWSAVRGSVVGTGATTLTLPAAGGTYFTTVSNGPQFLSTNVTQANTSRIVYTGKLLAPTTYASGARPSGYLFKMEGIACDFLFKIFPEFNACRFDVVSVRDSANKAIQPISNPNFPDMPLGQMNTFTLTVDLPSQLISFTFNGGAIMTKPLLTNSGSILVGRATVINGSGTSGYIPPGVQIEYLEAQATVKGEQNSIIRVGGSAAAVNASIWKSSTSGDAV